MAAVELVVRDVGLEGATVRAIAARAGVSVGSVYRRFVNKRALLRAVRERFLARRTQRATLALRLAREGGRATVFEAFARFVGGALVAIDRDRPLLLAFARSARSDAKIHAALTELIEDVAARPVAAALAIDVLITALRGHVLDGALPSGRTTSRHSLADYLAHSIGRSG
jgi:AcrR family transcriptional regulator